MRMQYPEGAPEWQACVDKELELRQQLSMPPPGRLDGRRGGPRAASPSGMVEVNPGFVDDSDRGDPRYQENTSHVDPGYLEGRNGIDAPPAEMFQHTNNVTGGGGNAVPETPPPPPPPPNGALDSSIGASTSQPQTSMPAGAVPTPRGIGKLPFRMNFENSGEMVAWGAAAAGLVVAGVKAYKKFRGGK